MDEEARHPDQVPIDESAEQTTSGDSCREFSGRLRSLNLIERTERIGLEPQSLQPQRTEFFGILGHKLPDNSHLVGSKFLSIKFCTTSACATQAETAQYAVMAGLVPAIRGLMAC